MAKNLPSYSVRIITSDGSAYNVTGILTDLRLSEHDGQLAQTATIKMANIVHNGSYLTSLFDVIDRVYVHANYEGETKEVFRGFVWNKEYTSSLEKELSLICYDNLIYLMQSEVCKFFAEGTDTETICSDLCSDWGIELSYEYENILHPKLPLEGSLGNIFTSDVLDEVKKQTGVKYVLRSSEDVLHIMRAGTNTKIYEIRTKQNSGDVRHNISMDEVVTQVIITGKKGDDDRTPIEATVTGKTDLFGTIQKRISKSEDTGLDESRQEAQELLDENGEPKETVYLDRAVDIPFLRKGDMIKINSGDVLERYCIVTDITHNAVSKTMNIQGEFCDKLSYDGTSDGSDGSLAGKELHLDHVPLYNLNHPDIKMSDTFGTFYLYDGIEVNGKYLVTVSKDRVNKQPSGFNATGWIDKEYAV